MLATAAAGGGGGLSRSRFRSGSRARSWERVGVSGACACACACVHWCVSVVVSLALYVTWYIRYVTSGQKNAVKRSAGRSIFLRAMYGFV